MRILFLDAYFEPEQIAFTHLEKDLLEGLVQAGHEIEIVCPTPTRGVSAEVAKEYKKIKTETLYDGHVHVTRFSTPQEGKNPVVRALRYFWCNLRSYQIGKNIKNIDVVFENSKPQTKGMLGVMVAKSLSKKNNRKVPFVFSLQDIFPDSLVNAKMTKKGSLIWTIGRKIEDFSYNCADKIIVISESMKHNIIEKGVPEEKIVVIPNWVDTEATKPIPKNENRLFDEYGIAPDKFIVVYAGNFGAAQGAEIVLDVAKHLKANTDIQFVIFGGGSGFEAARERVTKTALTNVIIDSLLPQDRVSEVYSIGDVAIITCKKGVGGSGMPSKTWSIMACDTPIIAAFDTDSELATILESANAGLCVEPGNANALADTILSMKETKNKVHGSRNYVLMHASALIGVKQYTNVFCEIVENT